MKKMKGYLIIEQCRIDSQKYDTYVLLSYNHTERTILLKYLKI